MRKSLLASALCLTVVLVCGGAWAQRPDTSEPQREAMKKLDFWIGEWEGSGWSMRGPGQRAEFTVHESVQSKLGGVVLLVQGLGKGKETTTGAATIGHDALAVVSFDPKAAAYRFRHYTMQGTSGDADLVLTDKGMQWELVGEGQAFRMRFHIEIQGDTWHEYGEFSRDGQSWMRTMEMTLQRVK